MLASWRDSPTPAISPSERTIVTFHLSPITHRLWYVLFGTSVLLAGAPTRAEMPAADAANIVTLQTENDSIAHTDRNYTAGIRLGWTSPNVDSKGANFLPPVFTDLGNFLWGEGRQRISFDISNSIFTPKDTAAVRPDPADRPYAGILLGSAFLLHDTKTTRSILGLSLGVLGPSARSEDIQNGFHDLIREEPSKGWRSQIKDMPIIQIFAGRTWRYGLTPNSGAGLDIDILPSVTVGLGNLRDYAQVGFQVRLGQGLESDFGTTRIRPGLSGSDAYTPTREIVWYFFGGAAGQANGWDATLDGNPFRSGPHVSRQPFVGELEAGLAVIYRGVRVTYTHVAQTSSFYGQRGGLFQFGSVAASVRF
jgi:lipid A 3-O-deacylase